MVEVTLLGIAQDGGRPQPGCQKPCCIGLESSEFSFPVALGVTSHGCNILIDATRDLVRQLSLWNQFRVDHLLLTHAHLGHVDGLGLFGREAMGAKDVGLHVSDDMYHLIDRTPAWNLMVQQGVFELQTFTSGDRLVLANDVIIEPVKVPHRAELSDMHAFVIRGREKALLYLPDHDAWAETLAHHHCTTIREWFSKLSIDIVLIDGTFWSADELGQRKQSEVPHPPVSSSLELLGKRTKDDPEIYFIHLNHTNPLYDTGSDEFRKVGSMGWSVAKQGQQFTL